jgi:hypothetical protein
MATRLYLSNDIPSPPLSFTPTVRGTWNDSSSSNYRMMWSDKTYFVSPGGVQSGLSESQAADPWTMLFRPWTSPRLEAQTIDGTLQLCVGVHETSVNANASFRIHAYVLTPANTVRGTLLSNYTDSTEFGTVQATNGSSLSSAQTLSSVVAEAGDRIVVEVGVNFANSTTSTQSVTFIWGGETTDPDLTVGGNALDALSWLEFSDTITFMSTEAVASQLTAEALLSPGSPASRISQLTAEYLANRPTPASRISQLTAEYLANRPTPAGRLSQMTVEILTSPFAPTTQFHRATIIITS